MTTYYQPLFNYLSNQHGVHMLESDMSEIINIVKQMKNKERIATLESEISRLKVANRNNIYRIEAIEAHLAEQHRGANFSKLNKPEADAPDYTHLLPDGYEFCSEEDAEKWVKVDSLPDTKSEHFKIGAVLYKSKDRADAYKYTHYRPIRPIQYKVTTHEIVNAIPDPYQPDWSKAPDGVVAHAWDANGMGYWYRITSTYEKFRPEHTPSPFTLPPDLDWKQSLRVKPN